MEVSGELDIAQSAISTLWQRFQDDENGSTRDITNHPVVQRRMKTGIWRGLLPCFACDRIPVELPYGESWVPVTAKKISLSGVAMMVLDGSFGGATSGSRIDMYV
ncbi:hypothetical protein TNCV_233531 [Trichonephila clavipes]|nr:hypothetical protein TNCV_233531 [Trichonephila clavipes]